MCSCRLLMKIFLHYDLDDRHDYLLMNLATAYLLLWSLLMSHWVASTVKCHGMKIARMDQQICEWEGLSVMRKWLWLRHACVRAMTVWEMHTYSLLSKWRISCRFLQVSLAACQCNHTVRSLQNIPIDHSRRCSPLAFAFKRCKKNVIEDMQILIITHRNKDMAIPIMHFSSLPLCHRGLNCLKYSSVFFILPMFRMTRFCIC